MSLKHAIPPGDAGTEPLHDDLSGAATSLPSNGATDGPSRRQNVGCPFGSALLCIHLVELTAGRVPPRGNDHHRLVGAMGDALDDAADKAILDLAVAVCAEHDEHGMFACRDRQEPVFDELGAVRDSGVVQWLDPLVLETRTQFVPPRREPGDREVSAELRVTSPGAAKL